MTYDEANTINLKIALHKIVETRMVTAMKMAMTDIDSLFESLFQQTSVPQREMELQFKNKMCPTILTGEEIRGEGGTSLEVALIDTCTGHIVDMGPEASANVEILVLKGKEFDACEGDDWFSGNIVQVEQGKLPLLKGNVRLKLERGEGIVDGIKFRNHTVKMSPPVFRLGARVVDSFQGTQVKEATTQVFTVKDFRNKYNRKHGVPALNDEVWRLQNIQKGGKIDERLRKAKILTVEDFLTQLLKNPEGLKRIVNLGPKKWEVTLNHARTCSVDRRRYCYMNFQQNAGVVFDLLGNVLGLISKGRYASANFLSREDKAHSDELLSSACGNWEDTVSFDSEIELQEYLSCFTFAHPPTSFQTEHSTHPHLRDGRSSSKITGKYCHSSVKQVGMDGGENASNRQTTSVDALYSEQLNSSHGFQTQPSAEDDMEIEHGHPPEATSSVAPVDDPNSLQPQQNQNPGPCGVINELFHGGREIEHGHPPEATSLVAAVDCPDSLQPQQNQDSGPSRVADECFYGPMEESLRGVGQPSAQESSYLQTVEDVNIVNNFPFREFL